MLVTISWKMASFSYQEANLHYNTEKSTFVADLAEQFKKATGKVLNLVFNGLAIPHEAIFQEIVTNEEERQLFERVVNVKEGAPLTLEEGDKMAFNRMVHRIMTRQEEDLPHVVSQLKSIKSVGPLVGQ